MDIEPGEHQVIVERRGTLGATSNPLSITITITAPLLFGAPDLTRLDGSVIDDFDAATSGETLTARGTGFGVTDPMIPAGVAASDDARLVAAVQIWVKVRVNGEYDYREAEVLSTSPSRTDPGVVDVTFVIPKTSDVDKGKGSRAKAYLVVKAGDNYTTELPFFVR